MNKEQQDLAWACLPKEAREYISYSYQNSLCDFWSENLLEEIYGEHNLILDTEPEEMLMVSRIEVHEAYKAVVCDKRRSVLFELFGDKCLPDKAEEIADKCIEPAKEHFEKGQSKSKFKVGDKVVICSKPYDIKWDGIVKTIKNVELNEDGEFVYSFYDYNYNIIEGTFPYLIPYTEENKETMEETLFKVGDEVIANIGRPVPAKIIEIVDKKFAIILYKDMTKKVSFNNITHYEELIEGKNDIMEEKELNLCELLKSCEGMEVYSLLEGIAFIRNVCNALITTMENNNYGEKGNVYVRGECLLYPSKELYMKYPLDAYSAWMEWQVEKKSK